MKLPSLHVSRFTFHAPRRRGRDSGSAVIVIIALLALLLAYVAVNIRTLSNLGRELRLLERQQTQRLKHLAPKTNAPPVVTITRDSYSPSREN